MKIERKHQFRHIAQALKPRNVVFGLLTERDEIAPEIEDFKQAGYGGRHAAIVGGSRRRAKQIERLAKITFSFFQRIDFPGTSFPTANNSEMPLRAPLTWNNGTQRLDDFRQATSRAMFDDIADLAMHFGSPANSPCCCKAHRASTRA